MEFLLIQVNSIAKKKNQIIIIGDSPVHSAVVNQRENLVEGLNGAILMVDLLIKNGSKVNVCKLTKNIFYFYSLKISNHKGDTPLHWAIITNKSRVGKYYFFKKKMLK